MLCWGGMMMLHMLLCGSFVKLMVMVMLLSCRTRTVPRLRSRRGLLVLFDARSCTGWRGWATLWVRRHAVWKSALSCTFSTRYSNISLITLDQNNCIVKLCSGLTVHGSRYTSIWFVRLMMHIRFYSSSSMCCLLSWRVGAGKSTTALIILIASVSEKYFRLTLISVKHIKLLERG